ncbi:hypothetical protein ACYFX5_11870 [Bremerella sp. T1]|uniref:hypothetical protein n=1 Tax=Bremerella sp. TYQ1 TaxID=3119568 RepID=UPI001CCFEDF8|nr:hypothetical protein [Bremerella volcania]UBM33770.1 hypothetical protein LA756_13815 [Bremerella volcania]
MDFFEPPIPLGDEIAYRFLNIFLRFRQNVTLFSDVPLDSQIDLVLPAYFAILAIIDFDSNSGKLYSFFPL